MFEKTRQAAPNDEILVEQIAPDFRLTRTGNDRWRVEIVSRTAFYWIRSKEKERLFMSRAGYINTDQAGANLLVNRARNDGLIVDFFGPTGRIRF